MLDLPITTTRLRIRHLVPDDIELFVEFMTDPEATRYLAFDDDQRNAAGAKAMVEATIASYASDTPIHALAVAQSETDDYVGSIGFQPSEDEPGVVEIFYTTNPRFQGRGFASEAASALIDALLATSAVAEVRAYVAEANVASSKTALNAGLTDRGPVTHPQLGLPGRLFTGRSGDR